MAQKQQFIIELTYLAGEKGWKADDIKEILQETHVLPETEIHTVKELIGGRFVN